MQTSPSSSHGNPGHLDLSRIAQDLQIRKVQVEHVVQLLDADNTIPFIARYRKERTGGLNEEVLRTIKERVDQLRELARRKETILRSIEGQGKLTEDLRAAILAADTSKRLEDLYLPYKPKKRTLATIAREKGLEPLALAIWGSDPAVSNLQEVLTSMVDPEKELGTPEDVLLGAQHILAELVAESADVRAGVRTIMWDSGKLKTTRSEKLAENQGLEYKDYFDFSEGVRHIPPHRILAINRGEKENALQVKLEWDFEHALQAMLDRLPLPGLEKYDPLGHLAAQSGAHQPHGEQPAPSSTEGPAAETASSTASPATPEGEPAAPEGEPAAAEHPATEPGSEHAAGEPATHPSQHAEGEHPAPGAGGPTRSRHQQHIQAQRELMAKRREALESHPHRDLIRQVCVDALTRLLGPSLEREIRRELTAKSEVHAVSVFARNLRSKLLAPPLRGRRVLAVDPGFRTGCKVAVLDETGNLLEETVIYPHPPQNKKADAGRKLEQLVRKYQVAIIAIGNGTACRETEEVVSELIASLDARRHQGTSAEPAPQPAQAEASAGTTPPSSEESSEESSEPAPPAVVAPEQPQPAEAHEAASQPEASPQETPPGAAEAPPEATTPPETSAPEIPGAEAPVTEMGPIEGVPSGTPEGTEPGAAPAPTPAAAPTAAEPAAPPPAPEEPLPEAPPELAYVIVNEAGASVYSASPIGREEFPGLDASARGTISIGRRLQDPLSELVKIDPQHVGVGLYQHDVAAKQMKESLESVIESCVNQVGVDVNTASVPLLRYVSGLNSLVARDLVEYRKGNGPFRSREQLMQVPGIGEARYVQAAGFLKIPEGDDPLDGTWIHPESYPLARHLLTDLGFQPADLRDRERLEALREKLRSLSVEETAARLQAGIPTLRDIIDALARPGRDPREDLPPPIFKKGILKLEDLQPGMELKGTILNVVDFGAFVDIGLKDSGLVHISQMANRYVKSPYDVVTVGDVVTVWVLMVDLERRRVSLTMIAPGTERKPPERRPQRGRGEPREGREPREGGRPPRPEGQQGQQQQARRGRGEQREREGAGAPGGGAGRALPPRGGRRGALPPRGRAAGGQQERRPGGAPQRAEETTASQAQTPPRKPRREPPKPHLSQSALEGATPLGTFAELAAFWSAHKKKEDAPGTPPAEQPKDQPPAEEGGAG